MMEQSKEIGGVVRPLTERQRFEQWYAREYARWLNTSDAAFMAWSAAVASERERWHAAASLAFDALALDAGAEQVQREADALRELGALLRKI